MKSRPTTHLRDSVERSLRSYAVAATAAGVGALAMVQPAEGRIVYKPLHKLILLQSGAQCVAFDNKDVSICWLRSAELSLTTLRGALVPSHSPNAVVAQTSQQIRYTALALPFGAKIGPAQPFKGYGVMAFGFGTTNVQWLGQWANGGEGVKNHYFGFRFKARDAKLHYGWARMTVTMTGNENNISSVLVSGVAYETIPDKPIIAGKTSGADVMTLPLETRTVTLGHLALGKR